MMRTPFILAITALALTAGAAYSQALPRIAALYPAGARAGSTVEVAIRGGGLDGARELIVEGSGISAKLDEANVKVDPADQKVFSAKCALCHELRGPATISRTAEQWAATVDRMIRDKGAPIESTDRAKIVNYLTASARAAAGLTAQISVAANAEPGRREVRVVGTNGTSTAFPFEVTTQPEALEVEPNDEVAKAPPINFPLTVSGQVGQRDVDCFSFDAKQGQRIVFNCSAYRLNTVSQQFFMPVLYLYDAAGNELVRNTGYFSLDPLIDWTAPADGKYVIMIRDMLYRGTPSSIYRLSIGSLPYKTYLFPPGGQRGTTTQTTVSGENMQPATVPVALPQDADGIRQVSTGYGSFPFVVGEYPEYVEPAGSGPQPVTLPASINGRFTAAGERDRYRLTVPQDKLGTYSFEVFAQQIGSPASPRLVVRDVDGKPLTNEGNDGRRVGRGRGRGFRRGDQRVEVTFRNAGDYQLEVAEDDDDFGPSYVYRISAGPATPDFSVTVSPDNPNLAPGSSVYLPVRIRGRVGISGDITLKARNLPPGVTASPTVIASDQNQAFLILTAAPDAKPGTYARIAVDASAQADGKTITRPAAAYEVFLINNQQQFRPSEDLVVTIGPDTGWRVSVVPEAMTMSPSGGPVKVTVKLDRRGNDGDIPFAIVGVPQGVQSQGSLLFKRGTSEMTFTMTPTNGGVFQARNNAPPSATRFLLAVVNGREGEAMQMCSPAVAVAVQPAAGK